MPRVPTLAGQQVNPEAVPTPYSNAQASPQDYGAGVAAAVGDAAQTAFGIYKRERDRADLQMVQTQESELRKYASEALWGKDGLHQQEGDNAIKASAGIYDAFEKKRAELENGLTDDHQKAAFNVAATNVLDTFRSQAEGWVAHQRRVAQHSALVGTLATTKSTIANGFSDPRTVAEGMNAIESNLRAYGAAHGVPQEEIAAQIGKEQAEAARAVVYGYLAPGRQDPQGAQAAYAMFKDKLGFLPESERHVLESQIGHTAVAQQGEVTAMQIVKDSMGPDGQVDIRKSQAKLDALVPGPVKDEAQRRVDHKVVIFDKAWKDEATTLAAKVLDQMEDPVTGEYAIANANPSDLRALEVKWPIKAAELKKGVARTQLKESFAQAAEHFFAPENWEQTARMSKNEFETDSSIVSLPARYRNVLRDRFNAMQKRLDTPPPESLVLEEARQALGLGKKGKIGQLSPEKKQTFADLFHAVTSDVKEHMIQHKGEKPDREVVRGMIRSELEVLSSGLFSPTIRRFQVRDPTGIPSTERAAIEDSLRRAGQPVNDENVRWMYEQYHAPAPAAPTQLGPRGQVLPQIDTSQPLTEPTEPTP